MYIYHCKRQLLLVFSFESSCGPLKLHSFPTRRSSDLFEAGGVRVLENHREGLLGDGSPDLFQVFLERDGLAAGFLHARTARDRKSTRLNSSHVAISYAVFCLKKKNHQAELHTGDPKEA